MIFDAVIVISFLKLQYKQTKQISSRFSFQCWHGLQGSTSLLYRDNVSCPKENAILI